MTKNTGGKKHKRGARPTGGKRELIIKEEQQEYGLVDKMLGDMRCLVMCSDSTTKVCHIRGKFKRRVWINVGDTVLISTREFEDEKADVIHKYSPEEAEMLKYNGEFDPSLYKNLSNQDGSANVQQLVMEVDTTNDDVDFEDI
jgi:translation initiation factor 1A